MHAQSLFGWLMLATIALGWAAWAQTATDSQSKGGVADSLDLAAYQPIAEKLIRAATEPDFAHKRLAELCDTFGPRLSGTTNLEAAIDWVLVQMKADGLDHVRGEEVMVPHWARGEESLELLEPDSGKLAMLGLGNSVGAPADGITAPVMVVHSFEELRRRTSEARGRIVLFNSPFVDYGETVAYRVYGPMEAAGAGAVAVLVRSITPVSLQTPH